MGKHWGVYQLSDDSLQHYYIQSCNSILRRETFGGILFDVRSKKSFELNTIATEILQLCNGKLSLVEIIECLSHQYSIETEKMAIDVIAFVNHCIIEGVLILKHTKTSSVAVTETDGIPLDISLFKETSYARFSSPLYIELFPTLKCNQKCKFCYIHENRRKEQSVMSFDIFKDIITQMAELKILELDIFGGEPLLVPWIVEAVNLAISKKIVPNISTNGLLLNDTIIKKLSEISLVDIQISLMSHRPEIHDYLVGLPGAWERAVKNAEKSLTNGIDVQLNLVVNNFNGKDLCNMLRFSEELGVKMLSLSYMQQLGCAEKNLRSPSVEDFWRYIREVEHLYLQDNFKTRLVIQAPFEFIRKQAPLPITPYTSIRCLCKAGTNKLSIMPDGSIFPCEILALYGNPEIHCLGKIGSISIAEAWNNEKLTKFWSLLNLNLPHQCDGCHWSSLCKGGCIAYRFKTHGNQWIDEPDSRCPILGESQSSFNSAKS